MSIQKEDSQKQLALALLMQSNNNNLITKIGAKTKQSLVSVYQYSVIVNKLKSVLTLTKLGYSYFNH